MNNLIPYPDILKILFSTTYKMKKKTTKKPSYTKLQRENKEKTKLISVATHNLRTPITVLKAYLSMLEEGEFGALSQQQTEIIQKAQQNLYHLSDALTTLLNFSRIEEGRLFIKKQPSNMVYLIEEIVKKLIHKAEYKDTTISLKVPQNDILTPIDQDKISLVLTNIIDNAITYSLTDPIVVELQSDKTYVSVKVKSKTLPISEKEKKLLFTPFTQLTAGKKDNPGGMGISLFVCKKIIDAHNGILSLQSSSKSSTTFLVQLPRN